MAIFTLDTLVLSPFAALRGGRTNELCLGTSAEGYPTPEIVISMRHSAIPVSDPKGPASWQQPAVADQQVNARVGGAGRSLSAGCSRPVSAGSPAARSAANASTALAERSKPLAWFKPATARTATCGIRGR
jgi:hypothetical protein